MERRSTETSTSSGKKGEESTKKKNDFPTRGYYAELLTNLDYVSVKHKKDYAGAHKRTKFIWQVKTEAHSPILRQIVQPERKAFLAPAERWMTFEEDKHISFPVDTFKPKVQLQHEVEPKTLPRNVAIERRRREYQGHRLKTVLDRMGIKLKDMLPVAVLRKLITSRQELSGLYSWTSFLPLKLFDNEDYDIRTPQSWLDHGLIDGVKYPLPGEAFVPNAEIMSGDHQVTVENVYAWVNAAVVDYNFESRMWMVLTLDGLQRTFELPRLRVMFKAEDPENFARRIKAAIDVRHDTENRIRYDFFLDCMSTTGTKPMPEADMERIMFLVARGLSPTKMAYNKEFIATLKEQIESVFKRTIGELEFRQICKKQDEQKFLVLPELETAPKLQPIIKTGMKDFKKMRDYFRWYNIYVIPETYIAMSSVVGECIKIGQLTLFNANYGGRALTLEEFESIQVQFASVQIKQLTGLYLETLIFNIRMSLGDLGKGWFDLNVKVFRTYEISKLKRFMELIKYRMQNALRLLVQNSLNTFLNLVENPCLPCLGVDEDFVWGSYLKASPFVPKCQPLFSLTLKMDENGPYYNTPPENFQKVLLKLFDNAIRQTHQLKQVHPFLLAKLRFPKDLNLSSVGLLAAEVCESRDRFQMAYKKALIPLQAYAKEYNVHVNLYTLDVNKYIETYKSEQHTAPEIKEDVSLQVRQRDSLEATLPTNIVIGPFFISVDHLRGYLIGKRQEIIQRLLEMFCARLRQSMLEVLEEYKLIMTKLFERPDSIEHIFEIRDWMETIPMSVRTHEELCKRYLLEYEILDHFWFALPNEDFENKYEAIAWPYKIQQQIEATDAFLKEEEERFFKLQLTDEQSLRERIETLTAQVVQMSQIRDFSKIHETAVDMRKVWKTMKEAQEQGQLLNQRQKLFGAPVVPFENLTKLIREFEPYKNLWGTASDWSRSYEMWMDNPILNIDADSIDSSATEMYKMMVKLIKVFADIEAVQNVAIEIKNQIDEFRPLIPLIQSLRNPGMRQRHWHKFEEETGIMLLWSPIITFNDCLNLGVRDHADLVVKIAESATKEYSIEQTMNKMKAEWENNLMDLAPYKNTGTYIMKISDDIQQMLDDHIVLTQQLSFSPFKGPFDYDIDEWEEKLKITAEVIDEWMDVQKQWMYLEPIFTSADITKQLPVESKKYNSMERTWRRIMRNANDTPNIIEYCGDRPLLESLKDCNHILQVVQKGLSEYLEVKRTVFPRLYFLSDDELLEILSQARNPLAVQPHLRKCFENVARLTFESDLQITEMFSAEEECVPLDPTLYPEGNVENWLVLVEASMKNTVRTTLGKSLVDMDGQERKAWVLCWPGQVVIACSQTYWTAGVETGIRTESLEYFLEHILLVNLDDLRSLVKGSLTFLQREILSALIVIEVHSRDVTQNLVDSKIVNVNDFDWISQLRYYWVEEQMKVRAVNAEFQYGYEYLGNSGRLVITPLTDRCYLTLTGALHLKFGGAPAGPAGTGKTETTKDLAKAMAIQCVVFNCSDQLDFMAMGKFFKGLASSGAWACFDEFNRIDIEVLSVVAQQITTIQKAQQACLDRFLFEGSEIVLKQSCAVFITMNPGYAGRTELPDNLKALFRPVSMMVPNYTLIAEISLFSFGFSNARQLANKITTTFKLSSEQLSSQDHYDFGMRAVKTVIAVAGNLKREKPNMDERQIVLRALRDVNVPKFLKDDLTLFNGIVSDLFPRMVEEAIDYGVLEQSIRASCLKLGQDDVSDYVKKVIQLYETTVVRHGLMLVGPTGSGKTKVSFIYYLILYYFYPYI